MKIFSTTLLCFILFPEFLFCQINHVVLEKLLSAQVGEVQVSGFKGDFSEIVDTSFKNRPGYLVKSGKELFCWFASSGRLYQISKDSNEQIVFQRRDSTKMEGYNIAGFPFSFQQKIYNIGGYGYWRTNGQLRVYNPKLSEWDIVTLNKEVPFIYSWEEGCAWMNSKTGNFYLGFSIVRNEAISKEREIVPEVYLLNLKKSEWSKLGNVSKWLKNKYPEIKSIAMTNIGLLCSMMDQYYLFSFEENKIYRPKKAFVYSLGAIRSQYHKVYFSNDSMLFIGDLKNNKLDSIKFKREDFEETGFVIYKKQDFLTTGLIYVLIGGLAIILFLIGWRKYSRKKINLQEDLILSRKGMNGDLKYLNEREVEVLKLIYLNSVGNKLTTVEEINNVMGLSQKSVDVQKKQRSDLILSINRSMKFISNHREEVILKKRTDFDKRTFEYFINPGLIKLVEKYLMYTHNETSTGSK